jgi:hypothetical protein
VIDIFIKGKRVASISSKALVELDPAIAALRRLTGRGIDPYATSSLEPAHASIVVEEFRRLRLASRAPMGTEVTALVQLLAEAANAGNTVLFEGE